MTDVSDEELVRDLEVLLGPGEIELAGVIVHTAHGREEELDVFDATIELGDVIAEHAGVDEWYVYSGNDDPEFASNQHQGLRLDDDEFVWECQHLLRGGTFDIVLYYETTGDQAALVEDLEGLGYRVTSVQSPDL